ncbi:hypothetical protein C8Q79DRAFT_504832 [Trametes meyenii]|nr:hypothetical protein C8Q79DRAFT_504832 [Trametes meyenii]
MPGANYMGGKRNTARARVKDAAGKVQRDHFGKKRFEILRSGLSRGQAGTGHPGLARNGAKPVPEISLAHARRAVGGGQLQDNSRDTMLRTFTSPLATTHRRSSPSSASSRSRILSTLDAANPEAQRSQVKKILQIPDLLGLSTTQKRNHPRRVARSSESSRDWQTPPHSRADGHTRDSTPSTFSLKTPPPQYQGNLEWTEHSLHAHSYDGQCISPSAPCKPNATFIPLRFDSSPARLVDDYGYADSWPGTPELRPYEDSLSTSYEPARVPFYPAVASPAKPPTPGEGRALLAKRLAKRRSDSLESLFSFSGTPRCGRLDLDFGPSPSSTQLPLNLTQAKFVSNLSSMEGICADARMSLDALPYSESLHSSWSGATDRLPESDDIPQASFSQSPSTNCSPDNFRASSSSTDLVCGAGYASACSSPLTGGSRHLRSFGDAPANDDPHFLQQVYLVDLLGGALFGEADPWCALDDVLDLPATSLNISGNSEDAFPELANAHDRCGVGYL